MLMPSRANNGSTIGKMLALSSFPITALLQMLRQLVLVAMATATPMHGGTSSTPELIASAANLGVTEVLCTTTANGQQVTWSLRNINAAIGEATPTAFVPEQCGSTAELAGDNSNGSGDEPPGGGGKEYLKDKNKNKDKIKDKHNDRGHNIDTSTAPDSSPNSWLDAIGSSITPKRSLRHGRHRQATRRRRGGAGRFGRSLQSHRLRRRQPDSRRRWDGEAVRRGGRQHDTYGLHVPMGRKMSAHGLAAYVLRYRGLQPTDNLSSTRPFLERFACSSGDLARRL